MFWVLSVYQEVMLVILTNVGKITDFIMANITLKIGRHEYDITSNDTFMDNGACVQLTSQSQEKVQLGGGRCNPVLSQRALKEIAGIERMQLQHGYGDSVKIFSLNIQ